MYYIIPNNKNLNIINENLILPLKDFSIGFDVYFTINEINEISKNKNVSVIINKFLHKKDIDVIKSYIDSLNNIKYFFIEDLGLINLIDKEKIVIYQNHIINNYDSINYFYTLNLKNIVVSNELTKEELIEIINKTQSNLFYFLIARNALMYSKRHLISSYYEYKGIKGSNILNIKESISKKELIIKEEKDGTIIFDKNIFSAFSYKKELDKMNFIINLSNMNKEESEEILKNYKSDSINLSTENYFFLNKIGYKVGEEK